MYKSYEQIGRSQMKDQKLIQVKAIQVSTGRWMAKQNAVYP